MPGRSPASAPMTSRPFISVRAWRIVDRRSVGIVPSSAKRSIRSFRGESPPMTNGGCGSSRSSPAAWMRLS